MSNLELQQLVEKISYTFFLISRFNIAHTLISGYKRLVVVIIYAVTISILTLKWPIQSPI